MILKSKILKNQSKIQNFSFRKIGFFVLESRTWSKKTLYSFFKETINLHVLISFFLFLFGVFMPIKLRYGDQFVSFFLKNSLPGISLPYSQISWETFEYLTSNYFDLDQNIAEKSILPFLEKKDLPKSDILTTLDVSNSSLLKEQQENQLNNSIINKKNHSEKSKSVKRSGIQFSKNFNLSSMEKDPTIERVDLYNDSILIQTNSIWNQQQKQNYIGIFPKKINFLAEKALSGLEQKGSLKSNILTTTSCFPFKIENFNRGSKACENQRFSNGQRGGQISDFQKAEIYKISSSQKFSFGKNWYTISAHNVKLPSSFITNQINKSFNKLVPLKITNNKDSINWIQNFSSNLDELPLKLDTGFFQKSKTENLIPINNKLQFLPIFPSIYQPNQDQGLSKKLKINGLLPELVVLHRAPLQTRLHFKSPIFSARDLKLSQSFSKFQNEVLANKKSVNQVNNQLLACKTETSHTLGGGSMNLIGDQVSGVQAKGLHQSSKIKNLETGPINSLKKSSFLQKNLRLLFDKEKTIPFNNSKPLNALTQKFFQQPRLMSGYQYPDMGKTDIYKLNINILYQNRLAQILKLHKKMQTKFSKNLTGLKEPVKISDFKGLLLSKSSILTAYKNLPIFNAKHPVTFQSGLPSLAMLEQSSISKYEILTRNNPGIKIWLPPSLAYGSKYNLSTLNLDSVPSFQLKYRPTLLEDTEKQAHPIYEGPGVTLNPITKDLHLLNQKKVLKWTSKYLACDNPLTDRKINFLGSGSRTESRATESLLTNQKLVSSLSVDQKGYSKFSIPSKTANYSIDNDNKWRIKNREWLENEIIQNFIVPNRLLSNDTFISKINKQNLIKQPKAAVIPNMIHEKVAFLEEKEWHGILEIMKAQWKKAKTERRIESETNSKIDILLPFVGIHKPSGKKIIWPLTRLDYQTSQLPKLDTYLNTPFFKTSDFNQRSKPLNALFNFNAAETNSQSSEKYNTFGEFKILDKISDFESKAASNFGFSKIINHSYPSSKALLQRNIIENTNLSGIYQRIPSIYNFLNKNKNFENQKFLVLRAVKIFDFEGSHTNQPSIFTGEHNRFRNSWEPLTAEPLTAVTQIYFALSFLNILQFFYKKYGKEVISYVVDLIASLGLIDDNLKDELQLSSNEKDFRLIKKTEKKFKDIAGIDKILPELSEIVWLLRNKKQNLFKLLSKSSILTRSIIPKGILFVGPPGTGKTLLVQAIAGEAEVPVLVQSGSSLIDAEQSENGTQKLKNMFDRARQLAPCILFIDEIDTLGEERENVMQNPMGADELMESMHEVPVNSRSNTELDTNFSEQGGDNVSNSLHEKEFFPETSNENYEFLPKPRITSFLGNLSTDLSLTKENIDYSLQKTHLFSNTSSESNVSGSQGEQNKQTITQERLSLLMQFLVEMDGLAPRQGVVVIGATNRPAVLDRAFTRPGRFDQILHLDFPGKQKRIEILKLYSQNLGIDKNVSWDYFASRTAGFSAADLSAIMNQSSIQAILQETIHKVDTIEHGIDFITSYGIEKPKLESQKYKDPFFVSRLAYYQAGKAILYTMLPEHPPAIVLHFWPYSKKVRKNSHKFLLNNYRRVELETQMIGLYAGKAAEVLALYRSSPLFSRDIKTKLNSGPTNLKFDTTSVGGKSEDGEKSQIFQNNSQPFKIEDFDQKLEISTERVENKKYMDFSGLRKGTTHTKLSKMKKRLWNSDLGTADLSIASSLGYSMINNWFLYSKKISIRKANQLITNQNQREISEIELFRFLNQLAENTENQLKSKTFKMAQSLQGTSNSQKWSFSSWWQNQIAKQIGIPNPLENDWFRIYLPDPDDSERNQEWVPPDQYWHNKENLTNLLPAVKTFKKSCQTSKPSKACETRRFSNGQQGGQIEDFKGSFRLEKNNRPTSRYGKTTSFVTWNSFYKLDRDYIYHSLVMLCFNKAFCLLEENRELLDYFAYYLIRFKTIRQNDIVKIFSKFGLSVLAKSELPKEAVNKNTKSQKISGMELSSSFKMKNFEITKESESFQQIPSALSQSELLLKQKTVTDKFHNSLLVEKNWGKKSRRVSSHFIEFSKIIPIRDLPKS